MPKYRVIFTGVFLALIVLSLILIINYIAFLEEENRIFLTDMNNSIIQLRMKIDSLETKRNSNAGMHKKRDIESQEKICGHSENRGFLIKGKISSKANR